jgi:histidine ammonia-lyase
MIEINGVRLPLTDIAAVAAGGIEVGLSRGALQRMAESQRSAAAASTRRPVYGRSTGVGANRNVPLNASTESSVHGLNLLRSHAVDAGRSFSRETVRAMLVIRLSQLAAGASGIDPSIALALLAMLNDDTVPDVRDFGGIGTADLPALAGTALTLLGERPTLGGGKVKDPLSGWATENALPFISSNALTIGQAVLAHQKLERVLHNATTISALSFIATSGNPEAFSPSVAAAADTPFVAEAAGTMRSLVLGHRAPARIQDPYCLRTLPQIFGSQAEEISLLKQLLERLVTAGHENPMIHGSPAELTEDVSHHGLFQMTNLARRIDAVHLAIGAACATTLRRIGLLCDPDYTGLNRFLASDNSGQSGVMMLEYVATAAVGRIRINSQPASLQTAVLSLGAEEDASFATLAAAQLESSADALSKLVAIELLCATRALRLQGTDSGELRSDRAREMLERGCTLPDGVEDRDLRDDLTLAEEIVLS